MWEEGKKEVGGIREEERGSRRKEEDKRERRIGNMRKRK